MRRGGVWAWGWLWCAASLAVGAEERTFTLRQQVETAPGSGRYHLLTRAERWSPAETAVIVCDVWDLHHCLRAVRRATEFAPRLDAVLRQLREEGATIIHAPSDCMDAYAGHPARKRAQAASVAANLPPEIGAWCSRIPTEERAAYPIDQSDGGEDDDPAEHAEWAAKLEALGRNPLGPWKRQTDLIGIDETRDFISDRGDEVWNVLEQRGIKHVILTGVHVNMCVLGRPFGLRQLARNGKQVVLMRDLTDTMYNPQRWPRVSHFTATDLIIDHIERYVCPTVTSDQVLGGRPFRFRGDTRPHVVLAISESGYDTARTLPDFARRYLGRDFRVSYCFGDAETGDDLRGLEQLDDADVLVLSARRRALPAEQLSRIRAHVRAGKAVVGLRTASHAFAPRTPIDARAATWPEFDAEVLGGHYHGDLGGDAGTRVAVPRAAAAHPILSGFPPSEFTVRSSLYQKSPLKPGATVLLTGRSGEHPEEPVAWTYLRENGGKSFYTSLGHPQDFAESAAFRRLLWNALYWAADRPAPAFPESSDVAAYRANWLRLPVPGNWMDGSNGALREESGPGWYRCYVRVPALWKDGPAVLSWATPASSDAYWNGQRLELADAPAGRASAPIAKEHLLAGQVAVLTLRLSGPHAAQGLTAAPQLTSPHGTLSLAGKWEFRLGDDSSYAGLTLPAQFAVATDALFEAAPARP